MAKTFEAMEKKENENSLQKTEKKSSFLIVENLSQLENQQSIMFTSSHLGEGTTSTLIATAKVLAGYLDAKILIVDGNLKRPGMHRLLNLPLSPGLSDILADDSLLIDDIICKQVPWAHVITGGNESISRKKLTSSRFQRIFSQLKEKYDYIFFDAGPLNLFPALNRILSLMDGVVLVISCENTRWEVAQNVKGKLEAAGANILGVILNKRKFHIPRWLYKYV